MKTHDERELRDTVAERQQVEENVVTEVVTVGCASLTLCSHISALLLAFHLQTEDRETETETETDRYIPPKT